MTAGEASNPFCTARVRPGAIRFQFQQPPVAGQPTDAVEAMLEAIEHRPFTLIVGDHGTGKSTLLHTLHPRLSNRFQNLAWVQTIAPAPRLGKRSNPAIAWMRRRAHRKAIHRALVQQQRLLADGGLLMVDGLEQLSVTARLALLWTANRKRQRVLATSHTALWPFRVIYRTALCPNLIMELTRSMIRTASPRVVASIHDALDKNDLSRVSNLREFWFELYDIAQTQRGNYLREEHGVRSP